MSERLRVNRTYARSEAFARWHGVSLPAHGSAVEIGAERVRGGFGALHPVAAIDGATPRRPLIAKVFNDDVLDVLGGPHTIRARVDALTTVLDGRPEPSWCDALLGFPFCVFGGLDGESDRLVALMLDLAALGYRESPFLDVDATATYVTRPLRERIELALCYSRRAALLEEIGFLHPDQNPENLMVTDHDVQIIDFDAGVIVTRAERPLTAGKPDDCMPPEVKVGGPAGVDLELFTPAAARWSVGSLIGYLLFGVHPVFFLRGISRTTIEAYAAEPDGWPAIDPRSPLYTEIPQSRDAHRWMRHGLEQLPDGVAVRFRQLFAAGLDGERRPTAVEWVFALDAVREPPSVDYFEAGPDYLVEGSPVTLRWSVRNATQVEVGGLGARPATGEARLVPERSGVFTLAADGPYGRCDGESNVVRVARLPRIEKLALPEFPGATAPAHAVAELAVPLSRPPFDLPQAIDTPRLSGLARRGGQSPISAFPRIGGFLPAADTAVARRRRKTRRR